MFEGEEDTQKKTLLVSFRILELHRGAAWRRIATSEARVKRVLSFSLPVVIVVNVAAVVVVFT